MIQKDLQEVIDQLDTIVAGVSDALHGPVGSETRVVNGKELPRLVGELREDRDKWRGRATYAESQLAEYARLIGISIDRIVAASEGTEDEDNPIVQNLKKLRGEMT